MTADQASHLDAAFDEGLQLAFPPVLVQLLRALLAPAPSFKAISGYLQMDTMLTGKVLHIVNSSTYGFNSRITDMERAAIAIGTNDLFKLVISLSLQQSLTPRNKRAHEDHHGDWSMTLWSAITAEAIAARLCPAQAQEAYLAGMLKDLPLFLELCKENVPPFLARRRLVTLPWQGQLPEELAHWGYSHPELAKDIFLYWGVSFELAEAVRLHHDFEGKPTHSRLTQSVIFATRWAELLHAPGADPELVVPFDLALAAELGLDQEGVKTFRASCVDKFNRLLAQLNIEKLPYLESRLHDQSVLSIQHSYFLALGALNESASTSPRLFASTLQRYLRLFWGQTSFELCLRTPDSGQGTVFRSLNGAALTEEAVAMGEAAARPGWFRMDIAGKKELYGFLALPRMLEENLEEPPLSVFLRVLGLHLPQYYPDPTGHASELSCPEAGESPLQTLALAHSGLMETLLQALDARICLLDDSGTIIRADAPCRHLLGANIFVLYTPVLPRQIAWNPSFLQSLSGIARLNASFAASAALHELTFAPLEKSPKPTFLMLMRPLPPPEENR